MKKVMKKRKKLKLERLQNMAEEKELRKMNRTELIEIIYALKKEDALQIPAHLTTHSAKS